MTGEGREEQYFFGTIHKYKGTDHLFENLKMKRSLKIRKTGWLLLSVACILVFAFGAVVFGTDSKKEKSRSIGERYHQETVLDWRGVAGDLFRARPQKPPLYKIYPQAKAIPLPRPGERGMSVEEAIEKRRSVRNYSSAPLPLSALARLLLSAQGVTGKAYGTMLRSAPSAGALYPIEIYPVVNNVKGLARGIYHYHIKKHYLELVKQGDFRSEITGAGLEQEMLGEADVTLVITAVFNRIRSKYGERGFRYVYMEAGHVSQNIYLQSVSLGLGSVSVGAFFDEKVNRLIGVDGDKEAAIYLHAVGTL
ncbi:SagB/ThcOx family dehydrogenase [Fibrobacterota bacterium]